LCLIQMELYGSLKRYKGKGSWDGYVYRLSERVALRWLRTERKFYVELMEDMSWWEEEKGENDLREIVQFAISRLSKPYHDVFNLYLRGYTLEEIAKQLNRPIGTVRWLYVEGVKKLRKSLQS
ncbi:MAG: RNA polymerase sigma factor, partial [bacterium]